MDVSNFYISMYKDSDDPMTNLRLNKFLYFAQAWSLVRFGKPLFEDKIEAWQLGPVVPVVYDNCKICAKDPIKFVSENYSESVFSSDQKNLLLDVAREYGKYSTSRLVNICHSDDGPWVKARGDPDDIYGSNEISNELISEYFSKMAPLSSFDVRKVMSKSKPIGRHDEHGHIILPKDWDE